MITVEEWFTANQGLLQQLKRVTSKGREGLRRQPLTVAPEAVVPSDPQDLVMSPKSGISQNLVPRAYTSRATSFAPITLSPARTHSFSSKHPYHGQDQEVPGTGTKPARKLKELNRKTVKNSKNDFSAEGDNDGIIAHHKPSQFELDTSPETARYQARQARERRRTYGGEHFNAALKEQLVQRQHSQENHNGYSDVYSDGYGDLSVPRPYNHSQGHLAAQTMPKTQGPIIQLQQDPNTGLYQLIPIDISSSASVSGLEQGGFQMMGPRYRHSVAVDQFGAFLDGNGFDPEMNVDRRRYIQHVEQYKQEQRALNGYGDMSDPGTDPGSRPARVVQRVQSVADVKARSRAKKEISRQRRHRTVGSMEIQNDIDTLSNGLPKSRTVDGMTETNLQGDMHVPGSFSSLPRHHRQQSLEGAESDHNSRYTCGYMEANHQLQQTKIKRVKSGSALDFRQRSLEYKSEEFVLDGSEDYRRSRLRQQRNLSNSQPRLHTDLREGNLKVLHNKCYN